MAMASTLREYLERQNVPYEVVSHPPTQNSLESAERAHISGHKLAKAVVLEDDQGYVMAVIPATRHLDLDQLHRQLRRDLKLADESELGDLFHDCAPGAVPAVGEPYGFDVLIDESLSAQSDIYFEAGDHSGLVHMSGSEFEGLMADALHGRFSSEL